MKTSIFDEVKNLHDHIPAIDSMRTTVFWRPPWILRP